MSREHYISAGIFDGVAVTVFGLPWCKEEPRRISLSRAVSKILCRKHNECLSEFDGEAAKLSKFLSRNIHDVPLTDDHTTLSGARLEKWSLKTLLNLGYLGALDQQHFVRLRPPPEIVEILFRGRNISDRMGLYFVAGSVSNETYKSGLPWNALQDLSNSEVVGMAFALNGVRFIVSIVAERAEQKLTNDVYSCAKIVYRPPNIILDSEIAGKKIINLKWQNLTKPSNRRG